MICILQKAQPYLLEPEAQAINLTLQSKPK